MSDSYTPLHPGGSTDQQRLLPVVPRFVSKFLGHDEADAPPTDGSAADPPVGPCKTFTLRPEAVRFIAYVFFLAMCAFAWWQAHTSMTAYISPENVANCTDGTPPDYKPEQACDSAVPIPRKTCPVPGVPPFSGTFNGVNRAQGFDIAHSHLMEAFGFNNVSGLLPLDASAAPCPASRKISDAPVPSRRSASTGTTAPPASAPPWCTRCSSSRCCCTSCSTT